MGKRYQVTVNGKTHDVTLLSREGRSLSFSVGGKPYDVQVRVPELGSSSRSPGAVNTGAPPLVAKPKTTSSTNDGTISAPMPGLVVSVAVKKGQKVKLGEQLLVLEAMKMENAVNAPRDCLVEEIMVQASDQVEAGAPLLTIK